MKIVGNTFEDFIKTAKEKKVIAFGASVFLSIMAENYAELQLDKCINYIVDNSPSKWNTAFSVCGKEKNIYGVEQLLEEEAEKIAILITADRYAYDIYEQLEGMAHLCNAVVFCLPLMIAKRVDDKFFEFKEQKDTYIPKKIHCFWLGDAELDDMAKKCIESWKKYCPDYEICLWTKNNYDVTKNAYMYEAYKNRKWAYATDYARLDVLYREGGIYFDLDLELYNNIDCLLSNRFFAGFGPIREIELAAFGAEKENLLIKEMLDAYENRVFEAGKELGLQDVQPIFMDKFLRTKGFDINGCYQVIDEHVLYPREVFSARNWFSGEESPVDVSLGIHHCAGSWVSKKGKDDNNVRADLMKVLEERFEV